MQKTGLRKFTYSRKERKTFYLWSSYCPTVHKHLCPSCHSLTDLHCTVLLLPLSCHYTELKTDSLLCYWLITRLQWLITTPLTPSLNSTELGSRCRFGIQGSGILREFSRAYWSANASSDTLFLVCFTMMSVFKTIQSRIVGSLVNNELEKKWP